MLAKNRARSTNGHLLPGVDGRSSAARRFRDLVESYAAEVGGQLSEADMSLVKQAAALTMTAETMQASIVLGKEVDRDQLIRITGTARRLLATITKKAAANAPVDALAEHLARHYPETVEAD